MHKPTALIVSPRRLRIGAFLVDVPARELLSGDGGKVRVTGKSLQVLVELARRAGEVVTRDELMDRVWADTCPSNDVLTQAIAVLRKALADDSEAPRYIETIAKSGYRLLAEVQWLDADQPDDNVSVAAALPASIAAAARTVSIQPGRGHIVLTASSVMLFATLPLWQVLHSSDRSPPAAPVMTQPMIIVSGEGDEWAPRLSPDGTTLVYAATPVLGQQDRLFLQPARSTDAQPLTAPEADERDILPVWSPDGATIAFKRLYARTGCSIMLIDVSGGPPRRLGDCIGPSSSPFDWMPDGRALVSGGFADPQLGSTSLWRMDIAEGRWRTLFPAQSAADVDVEPHYAPDGTWLAFRRGLSSSDLWRVPATGGAPERLTHLATDMRGFDWTPDGRYLVFNAYREGRLGLWSVDVHSKNVASLDLGRGRRPDFASRAAAMVFEIPRMRTGLYRIEPDRLNRSALPLLPSSGSDSAAAAASDGSTLAFYSDRSGVDRLWLAELSGADQAPRQVADLLPTTLVPPAWSADGQHLLVVAEHGNSTALFEVRRDTLEVRQLEYSGGAPHFADYLPSGDILIGSVDGASRKLLLCRRNGTALTPSAELDGITFALVDRPRNRILFTRTFKAGLFSMALDGSDERRLLADYPALPDYRRWVLLGENFFIIAHDASLGDTHLFRGSLTDPSLPVVDLGKIQGFHPYMIGALPPNQLVISGADGRGNDIALTHYLPSD